MTHIDGTWINVAKFISNRLPSTSYRVQDTECFKVPYCVDIKEIGSQSFSERCAEEEEPDTVYTPTPSVVPVTTQPSSVNVGNDQEQPHITTMDIDSTEPHDLHDTSPNPTSKDIVLPRRPARHRSNQNT